MLKPRSELASFHGKCIELTGIFNNYYYGIEYIYDESQQNLVPKKSVQYNPKTGLIPVIYFTDPDKCPELTQPIQFIDKGSVIKNVHICNTNIALDHIVLQCNINKTYNIPLGSKVWIYGTVGAYCANNKEGGFDYRIDKIINIVNFDKK